MKLAVVGSGIAGLGAAWALSKVHDVTLFEAEASLGGHAHTVNIDVDGRSLPVDTGFIVFNRPNYPALTALFEHLGVKTELSQMAFAVSLEGGRREYNCRAGLMFGQWSNVLRPRHYKMILEILRFHKEIRVLMEASDFDDLTLGDVLARGGFGDRLARDHILPLAGAIWSSTAAQVLAFPARSFVRFFDNHGLIDVKETRQWETVAGGSRVYVERLRQAFRGRIIMRAPIAKVERGPAHVVVTDAAGHGARFDAVVLATHPDQSLEMLGASASEAERRVLSAVRYQENDCYLHHDTRLMPRTRRIWGAWNYMSGAGLETERPASVSYWMNALQNLPTKTPVLISLNPLSEPHPDKVQMHYRRRHPQFDTAALGAQRALPNVQGTNRVWYCGAWCGYGFHEDGLASGLAVAEALGAPALLGPIAHRSPAAEHASPAPARIAAE